MGGDWNKADHYLQELQTMIERKQTNFVVNIYYLFILFLFERTEICADPLCFSVCFLFLARSLARSLACNL